MTTLKELLAEPTPLVSARPFTAEELTDLITDAGSGRRLYEKHGRLFIAQPAPPPVDRPGAPERTPGDCLIWVGGTFAEGYGATWHDGRSRRSHALVVELLQARQWSAGADRQIGSDTRHVCEVRLCAQPSHLRMGSRAENVREGASRRWPDEALALAADVACRTCDGPTTPCPSWLAGYAYWAHNCPPCVAAYFRVYRAKKGGAVLGVVPTGRTYVRMPADVEAQVLALR